MFKNYLKTALRNLSANKKHSLINILGLIVGFTAFLLIFLVVSYEKSFDNFHKNKNSIYRVVREGKNEPKEYRTGVPYPVTNALRLDFSQLANAAAIAAQYDVQVLIPGPNGENVKKFKESRGVFVAEQRFFDIFDFPIIKGNAKNAIVEPNTALLTKSFATRYFGDWNNAIGKFVKMYGQDIRITGIIENPPTNTDFPLGLVISYSTLKINLTDWTSIDDQNYCFVQLSPGHAADQFNASLHSFISRHMPADHAGYNLVLQSLGDIHYDARFGNFNGRTFSTELSTVLTMIGIFLLVIACINFINLSTASAINRSKEVGVRKVLGGSHRQLLLQFLGETGAACIIAMAVALIVAAACLPLLNQLLEVKLSLSILLEPNAILFIICSWLIVTILSGLYPALILAGFSPINALKNKFTLESGKGLTLRRGLVVFQFMIAQVLIIGTMVVVTQMDYFSSADLGFSKNAIVNAAFPRDSASHSKIDLLRNQLTQQPGVANVSFSTFAPAGGEGWATDLRLATNTTNSPDLIVGMKPADTSYFSVYNLHLAAGRLYLPSDTVREYVVNETLLRKLNLGSAEKALGTMITVAGKTCPIVGVVRDFHLYSLKEAIGPVVMMPFKRNYGLANIKIEPGKTKPVLAAMESIWNSTFPDYVFEYSFIDQTVADYYKQERQLSQLYKIFAGIAIFISSLGLYGLISFMAVRRRKEIGVRKVLGAETGQIVYMLSGEFTLLIGVAFLIASPLAWYFMNQWLQQYTYKIDLTMGFFVATFFSSILIAWLAVGHSAIKAARANPVKSLRTE